MKTKKKEKKKKVLVGLSGGVDSAIAALLLKQQGYEVIGAFIKSFSRRKTDLPGKCLWREDIKYAKKVAKKLGIFLITLNFEKEYMKEVIEPMFKSYSSGLTPNPDALCNKKVKFPLLWREAKKFGCDFIATGHYIKKIKNSDGTFSLKIPKDKTKDQSYFLYDLTQHDLKHSIFPIGDTNLTKKEVREIAHKNKFPNFNKPGTRGLCFVGKTDMKSFLSQKIKPKPGKLLDSKGNTIGKHDGIMFYTIGERAGDKYGIEIDKEYRHKHGKLYITNKNLKSNTLTLAPENHPASLRKSFLIKKLNLINKKQKLSSKVNVRIRHLGKLHSAMLKKQKPNILICTLEKPLADIAEGQSAVIYHPHTNILLGGGEIRYG